MLPSCSYDADTFFNSFGALVQHRVCCIVGETVSSDVCPVGRNKWKTIIIAVSTICPVILLSMVVCGHLSKNRANITKTSLSTKQVTEVDTTNEGDQNQPVTPPQHEQARIEDVESRNSSITPSESKQYIDILPLPPIAIATIILPLPPPSL